MKKSFFAIYLPVMLVLFFLPACSIKKLAMNQVANALTTQTSSTVFSGDNDPELVGDALPFAIKLYESLMAADPGHIGLKLKTGSLYIMYANAFLQTPALMLPGSEFKMQEFNYKRAKNLYLRGRDILLAALELKHPGFRRPLALLGRGRLARSVCHRPFRHGPGNDHAGRGRPDEPGP
jgi:hypothetical protein